MKPGDHSSTIERIAAESGRSPLDVLEFFNERAGIREHDGAMPRGAAEEWAIEDCRLQFVMYRSNSPEKINAHHAP